MVLTAAGAGPIGGTEDDQGICFVRAVLVGIPLATAMWIGILYCLSHLA